MMLADPGGLRDLKSVIGAVADGRFFGSEDGRSLFVTFPWGDRYVALERNEAERLRRL